MLSSACAAGEAGSYRAASGAGPGPGPVPTVAAIGSISSNTSATGATCATNGTPASGDLVVVLVAVVGATSTITPPSGEGWTLADSATSSGNLATCAVYWKRWGSGSTDNTSIAFTGTGGNMRAVALTISGAKASGTPYSAGEHASSGGGSAGTTATAPTVTTDDVNRLVLRFFVANPNAGNVSAVSDTSVFSGSSYAFTAGTDGATACSKLTPGAGATGTGTATISVSAEWAAVTVAIDPT
jgi:hypothetical protein